MDEFEEHLIKALAKDRETVRAKLSPADRDHLDALLGLLAEGGEEDRLRTVTRAVAAHLRAALPEEEGRAIGRRLAGTATARAPHELLAERVLLGPATPLAGGGPDPAPQAPDTSAFDRLLAEPALTAEELYESFGTEVSGADVIRLRSRDGGEQLPAFQFDAEGRLRELVRTVNGLLGAAADPWGVADWWLGPNLWLDAVPATLIGAGLDEQLIAAAGAVGEED
ncbi:DUF3168 domain-containing protein [Streptomyces collinus]|uniref:DUF3168 domain-containing protein n=1 Tax=Streptomyces collinus TaxID=42684 RepID=UPI0036F1589C